MFSTVTLVLITDKCFISIRKLLNRPVIGSADVMKLISSSKLKNYDTLNQMSFGNILGKRITVL